MKEKIKNPEEKEIKKRDVPNDQSRGADEKPKMRRIVIETNGNEIKLIEAEVSGKIELVAIFQNLIAYLNQPSK